MGGRKWKNTLGKENQDNELVLKLYRGSKDTEVFLFGNRYLIVLKVGTTWQCLESYNKKMKDMENNEIMFCVKCLCHCVKISISTPNH